ncbi:MAG: DUF2225 domain-containing protein [Candidatus Eisenbacteria sp.]|nr:DUF2225 domain-containing protein [Candidatus Eisenbacteria bacterium]
MSQVAEISVVCPLCREPFKSSVPVANDDPGPLHTDFRREVLGFQPRCHLIHTCPFCGYTALQSNFQKKVDRSVARRMIHALRYLVRGDVPLSCERYEYAARCAEMLGENPGEIADFYLSAAWSAQEDGQVREEIGYRKKVIEFLQLALETPDTIPSSDRATTTYLIGELYRRVGKNEDASRWLNRVDREIVDRKRQAWILSLAEQQRNSPQEIIELPSFPDRA